VGDNAADLRLLRLFALWHLVVLAVVNALPNQVCPRGFFFRVQMRYLLTLCPQHHTSAAAATINFIADLLLFICSLFFQLVVALLDLDLVSIRSWFGHTRPLQETTIKARIRGANAPLVRLVVLRLLHRPDGAAEVESKEPLLPHG
jgi:hypothetical protein